jgi:tetratricopeptide (TPR) repeat protein
MGPAVDAAEKYERGVALRKAGLFRHAVDELEQATGDRSYALKAYAQIGLCRKALGQYEQAIAAFRSALHSPQASRKETVQILYVLGRTLEMLGRTAETLEAYRWIRREDPNYRDVEQRIRELSSKRSSTIGRRSTHPAWMGGIIRSWHALLRISK